MVIVVVTALVVILEGVVLVGIVVMFSVICNGDGLAYGSGRLR